LPSFDNHPVASTPAQSELFDLVILARRLDDPEAALAAQLPEQTRIDLVDAWDKAPADRKVPQWLAVWRDVARARGWIAGEDLVAALVTLRLILGGIGLLLGAGATRLLLHYDGSEPVNILVTCVLLFGLQFVLLITALSFFAKSSRPGAASPVWFRRLLQNRRAESLRLLRDATDRWTVFSLSQWFGLAFNLGAFLTALYFIVFTDLTFAWSSTLDLEPELVHRVAQAVAWPWSWIPSAVPSLEVIDASRWSRASGQFASNLPQAEAIELSRRWWGFLIAGLSFWGLLPRVLALFLARWRHRLSVQRALRDDAHHRRIVQLVDQLRRPPPTVAPSPRPGWVRQGFDRLLKPVRGGMRVAKGTAMVFGWGKRKKNKD